uniref:Uncharacterized protein n=1 Tax=Anguilla anguilla TaxID=7936 RepID=A0A0E9VU41_ANGAN
MQICLSEKEATGNNAPML